MASRTTDRMREFPHASPPTTLRAQIYAPRKHRERHGVVQRVHADGLPGLAAAARASAAADEGARLVPARRVPGLRIGFLAAAASAAPHAAATFAASRTSRVSNAAASSASARHAAGRRRNRWKTKRSASTSAPKRAAPAFENARVARTTSRKKRRAASRPTVRVAAFTRSASECWSARRRPVMRSASVSAGAPKSAEPPPPPRVCESRRASSSDASRFANDARCASRS